MNRYFPSRKVFVVGVLAMGLLAWSIVYQGTSQQNSAKDSALVTVAQADSVFSDADGDGLYDWEETLYGTDVDNPDTDGDGVNDGAQYAPKDEGVAVRLSDSVYAAVTRLSEEVQNFQDPIELLSQEPKQYEEPYTLRNLTLVEHTQASYENYLLDTFVTLSPLVIVEQEDPLALIETWFETKSPSILEKIDELREILQEVAMSLIQIEVPQEFAEIHLSIANNLYLSALSLEDIHITTLDPMAGFYAAANYVNYQSKYLNAVNTLTGFNSNND